VLPGENGDLWFIGGGNKVGRIDPITGKGEIWTAPGEKENAHFHDLDIDANGNLWTEAATSGNITKFDIHTHEFTHWSTLQSGKGFTYTSGALKGITTPYPHTAAFDSAGNYWVTLFHGPDSGVVRLDTETGKLTSFPAPTPWSMSYGLDVDQHDNVWVVQQHGNKITKIEPSGKQTEYPLSLKSNIPRRIRTDSKGRLWFTGSGVPANISMLDPATGKVTVYEYGIPGGYAYWIRVDKHDKIWFNSGDPGNIIGRFDPETKKFVLFAYALTETHSGQGFVDDSTDPVSVYQGVPGRPTILRLQVRP
jgi:streptogramin lyase